MTESPEESGPVPTSSSTPAPGSGGEPGGSPAAEPGGTGATAGNGTWGPADPGPPSMEDSSPMSPSSAPQPAGDGPGTTDALGDAGIENEPNVEGDGGGLPQGGDNDSDETSTEDATPTASEGDDDGAPEAPPPLEGEPTHQVLPALPSVRQEHGAAALNGEVYVLGGFTPQVTASVQAYSPASDTWRDVADFPAEFHHPNVAVVNGLIYVTGFHLGSSLRVADPRSYAYDPTADEWSERAPLPTGTERGSACVATLGDQIYLFGGASDRTLPDASVYDTMSDSWEVLPLMPALREHCLAAGINGKIYIVSGRSGSIQGVHVESWMFDPDTQMYTERAPIPTPRGGAAGGVLAGRIFVLGGEGNADSSDGIFTQVEAYDPVSDAWESFPDMLVPRHGYAAAVVDDRLYLPGGATQQGFGAAEDHTVFYFDAAP